ncbi:MAG: hypothetical protein ABJR46_13845 [Tateyamaria sp.]|uniref:hypothetical protein n=1 Tax=Tateyamaria sp. TaxID=1929288 RepID=UPI00329FD87E
MRKAIGLCIVLGLAACGPALENDTVYLALKANPPTSIPAHHLKKLRGGRASCEVFEEGTARQYMTCWWPGGLPTSAAALSYYGPNRFTPPEPSRLFAPGGEPITEFLKFP